MLDTTILFRCAQMEESRYKATVGRPDAKRVFFANLNDIVDLPIKTACELSGRQIRDNGETIFVWIYAPSAPSFYVPATWGNLFQNYATWIQETVN